MNGMTSGESDPGARPILQEWVTDIRDQCLGAKVPFFFKQWGGFRRKGRGEPSKAEQAPEYKRFIKRGYALSN